MFTMPMRLGLARAWAAALLFVFALGAPGAWAQDAAVSRVQQQVQQQMINEVGGQNPTVSFDRAQRYQVSNWEAGVEGSGTYRRFYNDSGARFTYQGVVDTRSGRVYNVRYDLNRGQWNNGGNGNWNQGGGHNRYAVQNVQNSVSQQVRQQTGSDVRFNNDARTTSAGNGHTRVDGTGVMWRRGRQQTFTYSGVYSERNNRVRDLQISGGSWNGGNGNWNGNNGNNGSNTGQRDPDRTVDSERVTQTYSCNGNIFVLNGGHCNITITGYPREVRINGSHNRIQIQGVVTAITVTGADNFVRYSGQANPTAPQINNTGRANDIGSY